MRCGQEAALIIFLLALRNWGDASTSCIVHKNQNKTKEKVTLKLLSLLSPPRVTPSDAEAVIARMRGTWLGATPLVVMFVLRMARCQDVPLVPGKTSSGFIFVVAVSLIHDADLLTLLHPRTFFCLTV